MSTTVKELTSEINANIIESFKFYNNLLLVIDKSITSDTSDELKAVVEFKNSIGGESLTQNFSNSNKDRSHNAILLIIFKQIYLKNDKNDILKIFEKIDNFVSMSGVISTAKSIFRNCVASENLRPKTVSDLVVGFTLNILDLHCGQLVYKGVLIIILP